MKNDEPEIKPANKKSFNGALQMKTAIVYASVHHGNTKMIIDEIAKTNDVELIDATQTVEKDLSEGFHARDLIRSDRSS